MEWGKDLDLWFIIMGRSFKGHGKVIWERDMGIRNSLMVVFMKVIIRKEKWMVKVNIRGLMAKFIRDNGLII